MTSHGMPCQTTRAANSAVSSSRSLAAQARQRSAGNGIRHTRTAPNGHVIATWSRRLSGRASGSTPRHAAATAPERESNNTHHDHNHSVRVLGLSACPTIHDSSGRSSKVLLRSRLSTQETGLDGSFERKKETRMGEKHTSMIETEASRESKEAFLQSQLREWNARWRELLR